MRFDIVVLITIVSCFVLMVSTIGLISCWMKRIHNNILDQFVILHNLFLIDKHEKNKDCGCDNGEKCNH